MSNERDSVCTSTSHQVTIEGMVYQLEEEFVYEQKGTAADFAGQDKD